MRSNWGASVNWNLPKQSMTTTRKEEGEEENGSILAEVTETAVSPVSLESSVAITTTSVI